jgi:hypothetical protein
MRQQNPDRSETSKVQSGSAKLEVSDSQRSDRAGPPPPDEEALFGGQPSPRLFGEGSYSEGGSNEEGNWEERNAHPHGRYGRFSDAGGFGATELLGEEGFREAQPQDNPDAGAKPIADSPKPDDQAQRR